MAHDMAIRFPKVPKVQVRIDLHMADGTPLSGHVFVEATMRIQDLLNAPEPFFPFVDEFGTMRLINKASIAHVVPYD